MTVGEAIAKINYALRGLDDDAPVSGSDEYTQWLSVLNSKKDEYAYDVKQRWASLYDIQSAGTVASGTQTYDLPDEFIAPSDEVYVTGTDGRLYYFTLLKPQQRSHDGYNEVYVSGVNPKTLTFVQTISSTTNFVGGTVNVPGYYKPDDLTADSDDIPVDDPNWLVVATAADIAFNDVVYETKAADLTEKANDLYRKMAKANRALTYGNGRRAAYNVNSFKIQSPTRR